MTERLDPARGGRERPQQPVGRYLTAAEVARQLRVSSMTVYRFIKSGQLAAVQVGRGYRIRESDVLRYLDQRYMDAG